jgi:hypothetical protein
VDPVSGASSLPSASSALRTTSHVFFSSGDSSRRGGEGGDARLLIFLRMGRFVMLGLTAWAGIWLSKRTTWAKVYILVCVWSGLIFFFFFLW